MKHIIAREKMGTAKRNRGSGVLNWSHLIKVFPEHREHIIRIRKDYRKLVGLRNRLIVSK